MTQGMYRACVKELEFQVEYGGEYVYLSLWERSGRRAGRRVSEGRKSRRAIRRVAEE